MRWVLVAPRRTHSALRPLIRAREDSADVAVIEPSSMDALVEAAGRADAVLLVGDRRRSPRTSLPGPFIRDPDGRLVPIGWIPDLGDELGIFARTAASVERRTGPAGPLAILAPWRPRYLRLAERMEARVAGSLPVLRWTAERILRDDLIRGLGLGIGLAVYFGHGRPSGWAAYHGLHSGHLAQRPGQPLGALLSMTCLTASRFHVGLSFSETLVMRGMAASSVGAIAEVAHIDNMRWMLGLAAALRGGEQRLGSALLRSAPSQLGRAAPYRIIGDPMASLVGTDEGARRAARVFAPPPEFAA
jgi:Peptidase family C25